ncbi:hypothetical protein ACJBCE_36630 [Streptomyces sp. NBUL23]|uniref:hypothetical protein n=1 Tax=Streptomyces sp. NBUL23 TaxID=3381354 RepID=UPI003871029F
MSDTRPWIYGTDHDAPAPRTPEPGHVYAQLVGGPLDGQLLAGSTGHWFPRCFFRAR